ncbi:CRISPR-associated endoribonuclease cas6 [Firmicutes bacterium M10-2]|nr:CRISPR-associated endoribonuclease cas6 [Firmicutes bacterium M10-2]
MRLKIRLTKDRIELPVNYQAIVQGLIYSAFSKEGYGKFLHDEGYRGEKRKFKMFVFSNLFGKFRLEDKKLIYENYVEFYIGSQSERFVQQVYEFFIHQECVKLGINKLKVDTIQIENLPYFSEKKNVWIQMLSPVTAYKVNEDGKFVYYKPTDPEFEEMCIQNLEEKARAWNMKEFSAQLKIQEIEFEKKRIAHFKNTFYITYMTKMKVLVDYPTLLLLWNTGMSSKGSAGFGMIRVSL